MNAEVCFRRQMWGPAHASPSHYSFNGVEYPFRMVEYSFKQVEYSCWRGMNNWQAIDSQLLVQILPKSGRRLPHFLREHTAEEFGVVESGLISHFGNAQRRIAEQLPGYFQAYGAYIQRQGAARERRHLAVDDRITHTDHTADIFYGKLGFAEAAFNSNTELLQEYVFDIGGWSGV